MAIIGTFIGNELFEHLVKLFEEQTSKTVALLPGRFQPFHPGHFKSYEELVKRFGKDNVYITTSDKIGEKSPLNFKDKTQIMTSMFGIDPSHIIQTTNPYNPPELTSKLPDGTKVVLGVGQKDAAERLGKVPDYGQGDAPVSKLVLPDTMSATDIRDILVSDKPEAEKKADLDKIYQKDTSSIFPHLIQKVTSHDTKMKSIAPDQRIENPDTGRSILVRTALSYPQDHPAYKAARKLLGEGGAFGHLPHPHEDANLMFSQVKDIISNTFSGKLDATEKTDGQNLMFTVTPSGEILFARNKGQLKNPISIAKLQTMFAGKGNVEEAFTSAAEDLSSAINQTLSQDKDGVMKFFNGGGFMSVEIFNPKTTNVIPYDKYMLIIHGLVDVEGNLDRESSKEFTTLLQKSQANQQKTYNVASPEAIIFSQSDMDKFTALGKKYVEVIDLLKKSEGLSNSDTLGDYYAKRAEKVYDIKYGFYHLPDSIKQSLIQRMLGNKTTSLTALKKSSEDAGTIAVDIDSAATKLKNEIMRPMERVILSVGAAAVKQAVNIYTANNPAAMEVLKTQLDDSIKTLQSENPELVAKELERLDDIGWDSIVPSEGLVFIYGGQPYKYTGAFAPINQIMGAKKYGKPPKEQKKQTISDFLDDTIKNPETDNEILVKTALSYGKEHAAYKTAMNYLKGKMRG